MLKIHHRHIQYHCGESETRGKFPSNSATTEFCDRRIRDTIDRDTKKVGKKCNTDSSDHCKIPHLRAKTRNYIPANIGATKIEKRNRTIDISASKSTLARHKAEEKCLIYEVDELANEKTFVEKRNH